MGTSSDCLIQALAQSRATKSRLPRTVSSPVLNISEDGNSKISLGCLFQHFIVLWWKTSVVCRVGFCLFFMFKRNFMCFRFCPLVLIPLVSCHHRRESGLFFSTPPDHYQVFISTDTIFSYLPSCGPKSFLESISSLLRAASILDRFIPIFKCTLILIIQLVISYRLICSGSLANLYFASLDCKFSYGGWTL